MISEQGCNLKREARSLATTRKYYLVPKGKHGCNLKREARSLATALCCLNRRCPGELQSQTRSPFPRYQSTLPPAAQSSLVAISNEKPVPSLPFVEQARGLIERVAISNEKPVPSLQITQGFLHGTFGVAISNEKPVPSLRKAEKRLKRLHRRCNLKREARSLATWSRAIFRRITTLLQSQTRSPFPRYTLLHHGLQLRRRVAISNEKPVPSLRSMAFNPNQHLVSCNLKREARSLATASLTNTPGMPLKVAISNEKPVPSLRCCALLSPGGIQRLQSQTRSPFPRYLV